MHIYHDAKIGTVYIDSGLKQYKIDLPTREYDEVLYVIQSETFKAVMEQLLKEENK